MPECAQTTNKPDENSLFDLSRESHKVYILDSQTGHQFDRPILENLAETNREIDFPSPFELIAESDLSNRVNPSTREFVLITRSNRIPREDEEDKLGKELVEWFDKYELEAVNLVDGIIHLKMFRSDLMSEVLISLGNSENKFIETQKLDLLEKLVLSNDPKIRYGATLGIANSDNPRSIPAVNSALENEDIIPLRSTHKAVLNQLEATKSKK
jgi:hypothetical protein